ncbi:unnamed protein product [Brassica oleracea]
MCCLSLVSIYELMHYTRAEETNTPCKDPHHVVQLDIIGNIFVFKINKGETILEEQHTEKQ